MALANLLNKNFYARLVTSFVVCPIILFAFIKGGLYLTLLMFALCFLLGCEWNGLVEKEKNKLYYFLGMLYIVIPCFSTLYLAQANIGKDTMISLCFIVCASDIGAYFTGRLIGGPKINIKISPNKTWSGFYGALLLAMIVGMHYGENPSVAIFISILAQLGDLLESMIKRRFKVEHSSNLLPGHGGFLDRYDSFTLVVTFLAFVQFINPYLQ